MKHYPDLMEQGEVIVASTELSHIWECRTDNTRYYLTKICERLEGRLQFEELTFVQDDGRSEGSFRVPNSIDKTRIRAGGRGKYQQFRLFLQDEEKNSRS